MIVIENLGTGVWGVWKHLPNPPWADMVGTLRRHKQNGSTYWNIENASGEVLERTKTFAAARKWAQHHEGW